MTAEQFIYWLQGYSEIEGAVPNQKQWEMIQDHLKLVFKKETPNYNDIIKVDPMPLCTCNNLTIMPCPLHGNSGSPFRGNDNQTIC